MPATLCECVNGRFTCRHCLENAAPPLIDGQPVNWATVYSLFPDAATIKPSPCAVERRRKQMES